MKKFTVYGTNYCPYCDRAKALLTERGYDYETIAVDQDPQQREIMLVRSNNARTVPQIFYGEVHIGGFDDLQKIDSDGTLAKLIAD